MPTGSTTTDPSSLEKTRVVDWLGIEKGTGHVGLTIIDEHDWSDERHHLALLQEKLNAYLLFIESGEVFERLARDLGHPVEAGTPIHITIIAKFELTAMAREFVRFATATIGNAGFSLYHRVVVVPGT